MKKCVLFILLVFFCHLTTEAQKTTTKFQNTQARILDVNPNTYVKPLIVKLEVDETKGRVKKDWPLTREQAEIEMNGDIANIRSWGVYMTSEYYDCDVIVAATFNLKSDDHGGYLLTVVGYPASFKEWATATDADYEWIRMEKTVTTNERDKISAIVK